MILRSLFSALGTPGNTRAKWHTMQRGFATAAPRGARESRPLRRMRRPAAVALGTGGVSAAALLVTSDDPLTAVRHSAIAAERSGRIAQAVVASVLDYKRVFRRTFESKDDYAHALSECHSRYVCCCVFEGRLDD